MRIKRALISVFDKTAISDFARILAKLKIQILSSGGTADHLKKNGIEVREISDYTGFPEIMDGRVKTIHPKIAAGLLAVRKNDVHMEQLKRLEIEPIDMVVINLYPFKENVHRDNITQDELVELIDIGGPTLIRAAAKNARDVAVLTSPGQYSEVATEIEENDGDLSERTLINLRAAAFRHTAEYDATIAEYFSKTETDGHAKKGRIELKAARTADLRYGENPHQEAGYYQEREVPPIDGIDQLHGAELSYNNLLDVDAAVSAIRDFEDPTVAIFKHNNPCGIGSASQLLEGYRKAFATDPISAFGGIMIVNEVFSQALATEIKSHFLEVVLAPSYDEDALSILKKRKKLRILRYLPNKNSGSRFQIRSILNGYLVQQSDIKTWSVSDLKVVSDRQPKPDEMRAMEFAWRAVKHVKSNAIVFALADRLLGIGAGQMSRVDSVELAVRKAKNAELSLAGSVVASDAFFPFRDGVDLACEAGATAIIQPGGSIRDQEVIDAANEKGLAMVFTGIRHFKH